MVQIKKNVYQHIIQPLYVLLILTVTINTIKYFIPDIVASTVTVRFALYKGSLTSGNTCILHAQSFVSVPTNSIGLQTATFTVESGKSLTFTTGDIFFLGFNGSLNIQSYISTGNPDLDTTFLVSTSYNAGFPAFLTTALGRVGTNIHTCALFHT